MKKIISCLFVFTVVLMACNLKTTPHSVSKNNTVINQNEKNNQPAITDSAYLKNNEKLMLGIDFMAKGNEPFWSVEIDLDKGMHFKAVDGTELNIPAVAPVRLMDVAASSYRAQTENGQLTVIVYDQSCTDDMSGQTFSKRVEVTVKDKRYSGCGTFLADYRLHDIWVLQRINDSALNEKSLQKGLPRLEINLTTNKIYGHTGCNNINGIVEVKGKRLTFSRIASTRMACNDGGFENRYLAALSVKDMKYNIDNGLLMLHSGDRVLTYRKID